MPFKPKGDTARWRTIHDLFLRTPVGETLEYQAVAEALDLDPDTDRARIQNAARQAREKLLTQHQRAVEVIPDIGYKIVPAVQQIPLAGKQVERASNALDRGRELTSNVRLDELSEGERRVVHSMTMAFSQVAEWARQITNRVDSHEDRLADIEAELARIKTDRQES